MKNKDNEEQFRQYKNCLNIMEYAKKLEDYHQVFYTLMSLNNIIWDKEIPTACISFEQESFVSELRVSPDFFEPLNSETQLFVLAHECLHVIFNHPLRTLKEKKNHNYSNIAQDIVINEMLYREFGFNKNLVNVGFDICLVETVFSKEDIEKHNIVKDESFSYYYNLLKKLKPSNEGIPNLIDPESHENISDREKEIEKIIWESVMDVLGNSLSTEERSEVVKVIQGVLNSNNSSQEKMAGSQALGKAYDLVEEEQDNNNYWEKMVKKKISSLQKYSKKHKEKEHFRTKPRRLTMLSDDMFIPDVYEEEEKEKTNDKFNLFFFLDSSGSCISYAQDFFNLVKTIPEKNFNIRLFSFDTSVYELNPQKPRVRGGGGTMFNIIERKIQNEIKINSENRGQDKQNDYPDLVFVLTDGFGSGVNPEKPENWYWIMTEHHTKSYIPSKSHSIKINTIKEKNSLDKKNKRNFI